jgi:hypothetical protein
LNGPVIIVVQGRDRSFALGGWPGQSYPETYMKNKLKAKD